MNPSLVCDGRPGFFQNRRLREPPEIHRGHNVPFQLAERRGFYGPTIADGQFNLQAFGVPSYTGLEWWNGGMVE